MEPNLTARICCFARALHRRTDPLPVFDDPYAEALLSPEEVQAISESMARGIPFFDPAFSGTGEESRKTARLAAGAGTPMRAACESREMERLLGDHGFLLYEHLNGAEATARFFAARNSVCPAAPMAAPKGGCYCLAVKTVTRQ